MKQLVIVLHDGKLYHEQKCIDYVPGSVEYEKACAKLVELRLQGWRIEYYLRDKPAERPKPRRILDCL